MRKIGGVTVTFQLESSDIEAFLQTVKRAQKRALSLMVASLVMLQALFYGLKIAFGRTSPPDFALLGWKAVLPPILQMTGMALIFFVTYAAWIWMEEIRVRNSPWLKKSAVIRVDESGISGATSGKSDMIFWRQIYKTIETDAHFVVSRGALDGVVIPKRAFDSPAECAEFGALLKRKWAEHHGDAAPIAAAK